MHQKLISFNLKQRKALAIPELRAGDVVNISRKIKEGGKERLQTFQGTVIAINGGQSSSKTITVRKVSFGVGVELVLPLSSPQIEKIEFVKRTRARRAKLYYVRNTSTKDFGKKLRETAMDNESVLQAQEKSVVETSEVVSE